MRALTLVVFASTFALGSSSVFADAREECLGASSSAQDLRRDNKLIEARGQLLVCSREQCPAVVRRDCAQWLAEVETSMPTVVITVHDNRGLDIVEAHVFVDGAPYLDRLDGTAVPINPGVRKLRVEAGGAVDQEIVIREGEKNRLIVLTILTIPRPVESSPLAPLEASPLPRAAVSGSLPTRTSKTSVRAPPATDRKSEGRTSSRMPFVLGAASIALGGGAVGFELSGSSKYNDAKAEMTDQGRRLSLYNSANTRRYLAEGMGVAALGCAGAAVWFYLRSRGDADDSTPAITVVPMGSGVSIAGSY